MERLRLRAIQDMNDGVSRSEDIDSMLACLASLSPLRCASTCQIKMRPKVVARCINVKMTRYYAKRDRFFSIVDQAPSANMAGASEVRQDRPFYDFKLGRIDGRLLFVVMQYDERAEVLRATTEVAAVSACARKRSRKKL